MLYSVDQLPGDPAAISEPHLRDCAGVLSAARASLDEAKKSHTAAEQELPSSEWRDAELAAEARASGRKEPATRKHTADHEARIRDLAHEFKTCELMVRKAVDSLEQAIEEFGQVWLDELAAEATEAREEWQTKVNELTSAHARLSSVFSIQHRLGITGVGARACGFTQAQIGGLDFAASPRSAFNRVKPKGYVQTPDIRAALHDLANPPAPEQDESADVGTEQVDGPFTQADFEAYNAEREARLGR
jgi:hypothetical protein